MRDLLFLVHRIPYPPNKGDKIRSWNFLERLAGRYRVHVGGFIDDPHDWQYVGEVEKIAASTCFLGLDRKRGLARSLTGFLTGAPLTVGFYRDARLRRWAADVARDKALSRVFVYSSSMLQYIPGGLADDARVVVDFVDVDSDKWRQYAEKKPWPKSWVYGRESRTLLRVERAGAARVSAAAFVSEDEAAMFRTLAPESASTTIGLTNGVDCETFDPALPLPSPYRGTGNNIVFTGAMDYWANVDAVAWFAAEVFPKIVAAVPDATFWIVGANPAPEVSRLAVKPGIEVTGRVDDIRPYIAHADICVAPLRVARGIQNKVLEAMAMARPTVGTPEAVEGIAAADGREIVVADGADAFAGAVSMLLRDGDTAGIGPAARACVLRDYGWDASFEKLVSVLEGRDAT